MRSIRFRSITLAMLLLTGCAEDPVKPGGVLKLRVGAGDTIYVENWTVHTADLPALLRDRQPASVVISGEEGSSYSDAVTWKQRFESAGAKNVTIAPAN